jgi:hypothetical protein
MRGRALTLKHAPLGIEALFCCAACSFVSTAFLEQLEHVGSVSLFETTIRVLGGLLASQNLLRTSSPPAVPTADTLLAGARRLAERLAPGLQLPSGFPATDVDLRTGRAAYTPWGCSLAEGGSLSLEWTYLARLTGVHVNWEKRGGVRGCGCGLGHYQRKGRLCIV